MASEKELSDFLINVERRAFKQAAFAIYDEHAALDVVQTAMIRLAEKYGDKPASELGPLFQRILQNAIHDHGRRQKVRNTWVSLFSSFLPHRDQKDVAEESEDILDFLPDNAIESAETSASRLQTCQIIEEEIQKLPARQREAFLMRYWENMDVAETAQAMGCSDGSVKTHCSRATQTLAHALKVRGIVL